MILPASAIDRAPVAYEIRQELSESAMARTPPGISFLHVDASGQGIQVADTQGAHFTRNTSSVAAVESNAARSPIRGAPAMTSSQLSDRAHMARIAFACGWIFLAVALFCLAQSISVVAPQGIRGWRAVRAHS